jgi:hypothetical protein
LIAISAVLLCISLLVSPVWYDDAGHYLVAKQAMETGTPCYPVNPDRCDAQSPFITMGPALTWPAVAWMKAWGSEMAVLRFGMVLLSLAALLAFLLMGKSVLGDDVKLFFAGLGLIGNIQWTTYGAEFLGEVPMLGWLFLGTWAFLMSLDGKQSGYALLASICWMASVLTKEYALSFIGFGLILFGSLGLLKRDKVMVMASLVAGVSLLLMYVLWSWFRAGTWSQAWDFFQNRGSYSSEFLAWNLAESFRFLLFKPFVVFGTLALVLKVWVKRNPKDLFVFTLQASLLVFFLASAGYDRFGFLLVPMATLYLAEFWVMLFRRWANRSRVRQLLVWAVFLLAGWQQTIWRLPLALMDGVETNVAEKEVARRVKELGCQSVHTYDQQLVPFLPKDFSVHLSSVVPSHAGACARLLLQPGDLYLEGEYGRTLYSHCVDLHTLHRVGTISMGGEEYRIWRNLSP